MRLALEDQDHAEVRCLRCAEVQKTCNSNNGGQALGSLANLITEVLALFWYLSSRTRNFLNQLVSHVTLRGSAESEALFLQLVSDQATQQGRRCTKP